VAAACLVRAGPGHLNLGRRDQTAFVGAGAADSSELAGAARKRERPFEGRPAGCRGHLALKCAAVAVSVRVFIQEVPALSTGARDEISKATVDQARVVPVWVGWLFMVLVASLPLPC
jgi:hypothetical protein